MDWKKVFRVLAGLVGLTVILGLVIVIVGQLGTTPRAESSQTSVSSPVPLPEIRIHVDFDNQQDTQIFNWLGNWSEEEAEYLFVISQQELQIHRCGPYGSGSGISVPRMHSIYEVKIARVETNETIAEAMLSQEPPTIEDCPSSIREGTSQLSSGALETCDFEDWFLSEVQLDSEVVEAYRLRGRPRRGVIAPGVATTATPVCSNYTVNYIVTPH